MPGSLGVSGLDHRSVKSAEVVYDV
jgi:hypothetical protein